MPDFEMSLQKNNEAACSILFYDLWMTEKGLQKKRIFARHFTV